MAVQPARKRIPIPLIKESAIIIADSCLLCQYYFLEDNFLYKREEINEALLQEIPGVSYFGTLLWFADPASGCAIE